MNISKNKTQKRKSNPFIDLFVITARCDVALKRQKSRMKSIATMHVSGHVKIWLLRMGSLLLPEFYFVLFIFILFYSYSGGG